MLPAFLGRHSRTGESCQEGGAPTPGLCQLPPRCHPQSGRDPRDSEVPMNSRVLSLSQAARQQWDPSSRHPSRARTSRIWCQRVRGSHSTPRETPLLPLCPVTPQPQGPPTHEWRHRGWRLWCAQLLEPSVCPIPAALAVPGSFSVPCQAGGAPGTPSNPPTQIAGGSSARSLPAHAGAPISRRQPPPPLSCRPPLPCHSARHGTGPAAALPARRARGAGGSAATGAPAPAALRGLLQRRARPPSTG